MTEAFLHYVWQFQYFDKTDLRTTDGDPVSVFNAGYRNTHAGPDFFNAKVRIGGIDWAGSAEIHIQSSGWTDHRHDEDDAYENVILHVVWNEDKKIRRSDHSLLPTIELKHRVSEKLLLQYRKLVNDPQQIPCAPFLPGIASLTQLSMLDKALMQRLEAKATRIQATLARNNNDWDETTYQMLCKNFGFKVNAEPFEQLAQSLPYKVLLKHADQPVQVEAMIFGQAGFLDGGGEDDYFLLLKREYALLGKKFNLYTSRLNRAQWKFMRLRPANFPTLRLAQLSALIGNRKNIFSQLVEAASYSDLHALFSVAQSSYWQHHYQFFKPVSEAVPSMGTMSIDNIIINTVVPLLVAHGKEKDEQDLVDRAVEILQQVATEDNAIIRSWKALGIKSTSAGDSQALIELHNSFCLKRRCLDCNIGFSIIQPSHA
ncbi:DUF2851 family protein [Fulvivirgaceae bacterium PWU4]|uniref:DUF2851 family protein n=1 Tax=Chryseosolibacter histidini TaxID=2782349 RepID=A0AAP2GMZ2_9BACT|nr:DUF2851 family protein [Chryseosolibacter histidini]MBT1696340.1 DUF2851 family protein [Chryseosolibacter histidini]